MSKKFGDEEDDDIIVDIEDGALGDDLIPGKDEGVEEVEQPALKSPTLPDGIEEGEPASGDDNDEPDAGDDAGADAQDDIGAYHAQINAANERAFRAEANAIMAEAEGYARYVESELQKAEISIQTVGMHINQTIGALAQARDTGDTVQEIALQRKLNELEGLKGQLESAKAQAPSRQNILAQAQNRIGQLNQQRSANSGKQVGHNIKAIVPLAEKWASGNSWMKSNGAANTFVVSKSQQMVKEGWDMNTPGFYAELSRQVEKAFPGLKVANIQASKRPAARPQVKSPVAPARAGQGNGAARQQSQGASPNRYKLTSADISAMRNNNLDPNNKQHRTYFAKSRLESRNRT